MVGMADLCATRLIDEPRDSKTLAIGRLGLASWMGQVTSGPCCFIPLWLPVAVGPEFVVPCLFLLRLKLLRC